MGTRLTFDGFAPGCAAAVLDGGDIPITTEGASIVEPRVRFLKGQVTTGTPSDGFIACGPNTKYPMEVTLDQVAEIFYRVRDAWFTAGTTPGEGGNFGDSGDPKNIVGTPSEGEMCFASGNHSWARGYCVVPVLPFDNPNFMPFPPILMDVDGGLDSSKFTSYSYNGFEFHDLLKTGESNAWQSLIGRDGKSADDFWLPCAFNHFIATDDDESSVYGFDMSTVGLWLYVTGRVAFTGADHPFDSAATLYLGLEFLIDEVYGPGLWSREFYSYGVDVEPSCKLIFKLANSSAECQLYTQDWASSFSSDFVITAKKWWPYSHTNGSPAWNNNDGTYLEPFVMPEAPDDGHVFTRLSSGQYLLVNNRATQVSNTYSNS